MPSFDFRHLHPGVRIGTASDRYAGWLGQIYSTGKYGGKIVTRKKRLGDRVFEEGVLPVESVAEYFRHFSVLELDFTFYRPLLDDDGEPSENHLVLRSYASRLGSRDKVLLKVPRAVTARKVLRGGSYVPNSDYLDAGLFTRRFYRPALSLLGGSLAGFIFEQEYQKAGERQDPGALAGELRRFFRSVPADGRYHLELRTGSYLCPEVFRLLRDLGVGQVLSHWTWLPPLREQHRRSGGGIASRSGDCLVRLLTPLGVRYEDSYAASFPFDSLREGMISPGMIEDTVSIMRDALGKGRQVTVIVNNRAGGNAPLVASRIAGSFAALP